MKAEPASIITFPTGEIVDRNRNVRLLGELLEGLWTTTFRRLLDCDDEDCQNTETQQLRQGQIAMKRDDRHLGDIVAIEG